MPPPSPALEPTPKKLPPKAGDKSSSMWQSWHCWSPPREVCCSSWPKPSGAAAKLKRVCSHLWERWVRRAYLGERDGQISLGLLDKAGRTRVDVSLDAAGSPSLCLIDELQQNRVELTMGPEGEPVLRQVKKPALPVGPESKAPVSPGNETAAPAGAGSETAASQAPKTEATLPENPGNDKSATSAPAGSPPTEAPVPCQVCRRLRGAPPRLPSPRLNLWVPRPLTNIIILIVNLPKIRPGNW